MNSIFRIILITVITSLCCYQGKGQSIEAQKQQLADQYNTLMNGYNSYAIDSSNKPIVDSVIRILYRMEKLDSTDIQIYIFRANLYKDRSIYKWDSALMDISHAIRLDDSCLQCYLTRAALWPKAGNKEKIMADYKMAIALDSNYIESYDQFHDYCISYDTKEGARLRKLAQQHFRMLVLQDSTIAQSWYLLGRAYDLLYRNNWTIEIQSIKVKCMYAYSKAIELDSMQIEYYERRSWHYCFDGNPEGDLHDELRILAIHESSFNRSQVIGSYIVLGKLETAMQMIDESLVLYPDDDWLLWKKQDLAKKMKSRTTPKK